MTAGHGRDAGTTGTTGHVGTARPSPPATDPFSELSARRLGPIRRYFVRHPVAMDVAVMVFVAAWVMVGSISTGLEGEAPTQTSPPYTLPGIVISIAMIAVLFWRRRRPVPVFGAVVSLFVLVVAVTGTTSTLDIGLALVVYAIAVSYPTWAGWAAVVIAAGAANLSIWLWVRPTIIDGVDLDQRTTSMVGIVLMGLIAMTIGFNVRNRRLHVADLVERANAIARDRDQQAQIARAAERSRIAREMHDVVAHSLSVMIALADGAAASVERAPERARIALDELADTGRAALTDMRRVLGVLDSDAPLEPPGNPDLTELVERFRAAGLPVHTQGLDAAVPADTGLQLAVYRIVQEGLTNVLRYARGTPVVDVVVSRQEGLIRVELTDHGSAGAVPDAGGAGRGLIGMAERAALFGGTVDAGPWNGGWRVRAELPWKDDHA